MDKISFQGRFIKEQGVKTAVGKNPNLRKPLKQLARFVETQLPEKAVVTCSLSEFAPNSLDFRAGTLLTRTDSFDYLTTKTPAGRSEISILKDFFKSKN